jgi:hypothetical protein
MARHIESRIPVHAVDWLTMLDRLALAVRQGEVEEHAHFSAPEDRGTATASDLGAVEYVEDLLRPGRIVVWAAEEGAGKSFAVDDELGIRVAVAGGSFAGTWPVRQTGPVLVLSEMHTDDDFEREAMVLESLHLERSALTGRYFRLPLMTAAGERPALSVAGWRSWVIDWLKVHAALLLVVDTATGATQVEPWGREIQAVYRDLRAMLADYPALAIVLVVHLRKPNGRGERRLSDVLGEWGRWADVVVLMENDGTSLTQTRLTIRKRVRRERRIVATKRGGLLVDPIDAGTIGGSKVPLADVVAAVAAEPGMTATRLGEILKVSQRTARIYSEAAEAAGRIVRRRAGGRGALTFFPVVEHDGPPGIPESPGITHGFRVSSGSSVTDGEMTRNPESRLYKNRVPIPGASPAAPYRVEDDYGASAWDAHAGEDDPLTADWLAAPLPEPRP